MAITKSGWPGGADPPVRGRRPRRPPAEGRPGGRPRTGGSAPQSGTALGRALGSRHATSRGSALLTVLWLSAALAAIAFSLANTVLGETDRTSTEVDGLRCYYLAAGAIHRAYIEELWSFTMPPDTRRIPRGATAVDYVFPSGNAHVEITPETAKLDVNAAPVQDLFRLGVALGIAPERAQDIAAAIEEWRRPAAGGGLINSQYLSLTPSFRASHASIQEIEELLRVRGVTPDIFYGTYVPSQSLAAAPAEAGAQRLIPRPGLVDCLSVYGSKDRVDANTASPAVLAAVGLSPYAIGALLQRRRMGPLLEDQLGAFLQSVGVGAARLRVGGNSIVTLRATAQLRLANGQVSDLKRTVAAQVKFMPTGYDSPIHILRWYDMAWSN